MDELIYEIAEKNELRLARFSKRALATIIDSVLLVTILFILTFYGIKKNNFTQEELSIVQSILNSSQTIDLDSIFINNQQFMDVIGRFRQSVYSAASYFVMVYFAYILIFTYFYGASVGKIVCKIRILDYKTLDKPNFTSSFKRAFVKTVTDIFMPLFGLVGYALFFSGKSKRSLSDMFSKTIVVENIF